MHGGVVALVGGREVARIGLGGMFGERALIRNEPRAATIVAVGDTEVAGKYSKAKESVHRVYGKHCSFQISITSSLPSNLFSLPLLRISCILKTPKQAHFF